MDIKLYGCVVAADICKITILSDASEITYSNYDLVYQAAVNACKPKELRVYAEICGMHYSHEQLDQLLADNSIHNLGEIFNA